MNSDPIHAMFLAQYQLLDIQSQTAHAFLDSKNVSRTNSQRQPYTLAERIAKMVGDLPAEVIPVDEHETPPPTGIAEPEGGWVAPTYAGFTFIDDDAHG